MIAFQEITNEINIINSEFQSLILAPITQPFAKSAYAIDISNLQQKIKLFPKNSKKISDELDQVFIEDENKFDRIVKQWLIKIDKAFEGIVFHFSDGLLKAETVQNEQKFWMEYMGVQAKIYNPNREEKRPTISLEEWGVYYAYTLFEFKITITEKVNRLKAKESYQFEKKEMANNNDKPQNSRPIDIAINPIIKPEAINQIFEILKDFFRGPEQTALKEILATGNDAVAPLLFLDNGNRLADAFKQLIKSDFVTGCDQVLAITNYL
jgi:hypothetical protein